MGAMGIAATGMMAQQMQIEQIAHDLANLGTTGFKQGRLEFADLLYQKQIRAGMIADEAGAIIPAGVEVGSGTKVAGVYRIHEQGKPFQTSSTYDLAIRGNGFFRVEMPDGTFAYTRAGSFRLSPESLIVTDQGLVVTPGITIPPEVIADGVFINSAGQVSVLVAGNNAPEIVGQFDLVDFPNEVGLSAIGDNLLVETQASGAARVGTPTINGLGELLQGWLEASNVDSITKITAMIVAQRNYELCSKAITTEDEMLQTITRLKS